MMKTMKYCYSLESGCCGSSWAATRSASSSWAFSFSWASWAVVVVDDDAVAVLGVKTTTTTSFGDSLEDDDDGPTWRRPHRWNCGCVGVWSHRRR